MGALTLATKYVMTTFDVLKAGSKIKMIRFKNGIAPSRLFPRDNL